MLSNLNIRIQHFIIIDSRKNGEGREEKVFCLTANYSWITPKKQRTFKKRILAELLFLVLSADKSTQKEM